MEPVILTTDRLVLRPLGPDDTDAVYAACQDPEIQRWTTVPSPYRHEHAVAFTTTSCPEGWRNGTLYNFGAFTRDTGELVSSIGLVGITPARVGERIGEIGFWTAREHRGRGYTAEAARAVAGWAFGPLGIERLEWIAEAGNKASRGVAVKVGFRLEGTLRARLVHSGTRRDAWAGSLLPSDLGLPSATPWLPYEPE